MRGQAATDYLLALAVILVLIAAAVLPLLGEAELTSVMAAARSGASSYAIANRSLAFTSLDYVNSGGNVTLRPKEYLGSIPYPGDAQLRLAIVTSIAGTLKPSLPVDASVTCVRGLYHNYCVDVG